MLNLLQFFALTHFPRETIQNVHSTLLPQQRGSKVQLLFLKEDIPNPNKKSDWIGNQDNSSLYRKGMRWIFSFRTNSPASLTDSSVLYGWLIHKFPWQGFSLFFEKIWPKNEVKPCHGNLRMSHKWGRWVWPITSHSIECANILFKVYTQLHSIMAQKY